MDYKLNKDELEFEFKDFKSLNSKKTIELIRYAKANLIHGYRGLNKENLIRLIISDDIKNKYGIRSELNEESLSSFPKEMLINIARDYKFTNYSRCNKSKLIELIISNTKMIEDNHLGLENLIDNLEDSYINESYIKQYEKFFAGDDVYKDPFEDINNKDEYVEIHDEYTKSKKNKNPNIKKIQEYSGINKINKDK